MESESYDSNIDYKQKDSKGKPHKNSRDNFPIEPDTTIPDQNDPKYLRNSMGKAISHSDQAFVLDSNRQKTKITPPSRSDSMPKPITYQQPHSSENMKVNEKKISFSFEPSSKENANSATEQDGSRSESFEMQKKSQTHKKRKNHHPHRQGKNSDEPEPDDKASRIKSHLSLLRGSSLRDSYVAQLEDLSILEHTERKKQESLDPTDPTENKCCKFPAIPLVLIMVK